LHQIGDVTKQAADRRPQDMKDIERTHEHFLASDCGDCRKPSPSMYAI
jgi:hypothetical protein